MTDTILLVAIALLTVNILLVGVYIVLVLKEVRQSVVKVNQILDSFSAISSAISHPISKAPGTISAVIEGVKAFRTLQETLQKRKDRKEVPSEVLRKEEKLK
ncbi:MAG: hypothetical protein BMS9Abin34_344 [Patescibacteria group bacterium]|nr:MAG: hypothetical protein BMS9Abin34_344 [Patescibacteria group bacterium]